MLPPISPWHWETVRVESPDGRKFAVVSDPSEIRMGAPSSGELKVSNGQSASNCSPSIAWSDDSRFLAFPQWKDSFQRLVILDTEASRRAFAPGTYRVLEIHSFRNGLVEGIDSPIHEARKFAFDVRALFPDV